MSVTPIRKRDDAPQETAFRSHGCTVTFVSRRLNARGEVISEVSGVLPDKLSTIALTFLAMISVRVIGDEFPGDAEMEAVTDRALAGLRAVADALDAP